MNTARVERSKKIPGERGRVSAPSVCRTRGANAAPLAYWSLSDNANRA